MKKFSPITLSLLIHLFLLFIWGGRLYQQSAYSIASQVREISMEMIPEIEPAFATTTSEDFSAIVPPKNEEKKEIKPEIIKLKKEIKKTPNTTNSPKQVVKQKPLQSNQVLPQTARGSLSGESASAKYNSNAAPDYLKNPPPSYPAVSKRRGEEGLVLLNVKISSAGEALAITINRSSTFIRLDNAAIESVKSWHFLPAKLAGIPVASEAVVPIRFVLK